MKTTGIERVPVQDQKALSQQEAIHRVQHVPGNLRQPWTVRHRCKSSNLYATRLQLHHKKHAVPLQATQSQHFHSEEVCRGDCIPISAKKRAPTATTPAFRRRFKPCLKQQTLDGVSSHLMTQHAKRTSNTRVPPPRILLRHANNKLSYRRCRSGPPRWPLIRFVHPATVRSRKCRAVRAIGGATSSRKCLLAQHRKHQKS